MSLFDNMLFLTCRGVAKRKEGSRGELNTASGVLRNNFFKALKIYNFTKTSNFLGRDTTHLLDPILVGHPSPTPHSSWPSFACHP